MNAIPTGTSTSQPHAGLAALLLAGVVLGLLTHPNPVRAQGFDVGSLGSLGDVVISVNSTVDLPEDGRLHYKSLTVEAGARLNFTRNARNTPVLILSQGDVVVKGVIDVNGSGPTANTGGSGGPGGFDGGKPGFGAETPPGAGYGPGGGQPGGNFCSNPFSGAHAGSFGGAGISAPASKTYGTALLLPVIGGSGGGGGTPGASFGGGGGGGAILIASNTRIEVAGTIEARGGFGGTCDNAGSGGAVRLVAFKLEGNGFINVTGGATPSRGVGAGGPGRIRFDAVDRTQLAIQTSHPGVSVTGGNLISIPAVSPRLDTVEVAGNAVALDSGPATFVLPFGSSTNRTVRIRAADFGRLVPIRVTLTPDSGSPVIFDAEIDNLAENPAFVDVPVTVPVNTLVTVHAWTR